MNSETKMAENKRKHESEPKDELYSNKSRSRPAVTARFDPTYGQRSAIPLDEEGDKKDDFGDIAYDEEMDALAYLKSVRREAGGIPHLLVAPKTAQATDSREIYENGVGDYRGRYNDGAFYAEPSSNDEDDYYYEEPEEDLQTRYFNSILLRFASLREQLYQPPPLEALQKLDEDHPIYLGSLSVPKVRWWRWKLRTTDPMPAQIASMDKDTVLGLLKLMAGGALLKRGVEVDMGVSRWAWSLLAKLPERGELGSEEIGIVRELGKKAVLVAIGIREGYRWEEGIQEFEAEYDDGEEVETEIVSGDEIPLDDEDSFQDGDELENDAGDEIGPVSATAEILEPQTNSAVPEVAEALSSDKSTELSELDELAAAKARILGSLSTPISDAEYNIEPEMETPPQEVKGETSTEAEKVTNPESDFKKWNSNATVDMILTIAGEMYGQRDLLEFRGEWGDSV